LGVYIGLLLVGAPTGVLAQPAAMTRNFEISEEIVMRDELDNDPELSADEDVDFAVEHNLFGTVPPISAWTVPVKAAEFACGQNWFIAPIFSDAIANLHSEFPNAFARFKPDADDENYELTKTILKRTSLTVANEQVFTVTRLPRSDIDPLLATNAK
jgi:hypothetical protein